MSSALWLPRVHREQVEQTKAEDAAAQQMVHVAGVMRYWTQRLQRELNDPRLEVVRADPLANPTIFKPGYYHVLRHNEPPAPMSIMPIQDSDGGFAEPHSGLAQELRESDLQNPQVIRERDQRVAKEERAKERARTRDEVERMEHLRDSMNAAWRTSVSMVPGWSQNVQGKKGRSR